MAGRPPKYPAHKNCRTPSNKTKLCPAAKRLRVMFAKALVELGGLSAAEIARVAGYAHRASVARLV